MPNNDPPETEVTQLSTTITRGAICHPTHVDREIKMFLVQENELKIISVFNSQMMLWSSVGAAALALVAACVWDLVTSDIDSRTGVVFCGAALVVSAISGGFVWWNSRSKEKLLAAIQDASKDSNG